MTPDTLRKKYLKFFQSKNHVIIPSASLLPENDSTTLFTSSGMQPILPYLLGEKHPEGNRICNSQKCFRTQDIEEVGDNRHTTFFEMLGNWSLGDYFKKEQISWIFEFLIKELNLDPKKIYVTVFRGKENLNISKDEEAVNFWQNEFAKVGIEAKAVDFSERDGLNDGRIFFYDDKKNWWSRAGAIDNMPVGEPGGPDSEIFWDFGQEYHFHENSKYKDEPCHVNCDCGRFMEIGNNVFMQYAKIRNGVIPLKNKNIDFGGGLERMLAALENEPDIFKTEIFLDVIKEIELLSGKTYSSSEEKIKYGFRVIADHLRAALFLIADGALPSNKDQGYFTRRCIRRSLRYANKINIHGIFTDKIIRKYIKIYKDNYKYLKEEEQFIINEILKEEEKFSKTLEKGLKEFNGILKDSKSSISGIDAFILFSTYGFPFEVTEEIAKENGLEVDKTVFEEEMRKHQKLSRAGMEQKFKSGLLDNSDKTIKYHTATHLLHAALRQVLGKHVEQKGSNITPERLRFDFFHNGKLTAEQKREVENIINGEIEKGLSVYCEELTVDEAKKSGAIGLFETKYGDKVKVYTIGKSASEYFSKEICSGPHVQNTSELGKFKIEKEESSSAGIRRIKAVLIDKN